MTEPNERSDPVALHTDVTPEQLDALHTTCNHWNCEGLMRAKIRQDLQSTTASLERVSAALTGVTEALHGNPWGRLQATDEPLAEWERLLLEGAEAERQAPRETVARALQAGTDLEQHRANLQAGLQHQRIRSRIG